MCRGSVLANDQEDAQPGVRYHISTSHHHGGNHLHGVLHRPGKGVVNDPAHPSERAIACAACIRETTQVELSGIPFELQQRHGLAESARLTFLSGDQEEIDQKDKIELPDGRRIDLSEFGDAGIVLQLVAADVAARPDTQPAATERTLVAA